MKSIQTWVKMLFLPVLLIPVLMACHSSQNNNEASAEKAEMSVQQLILQLNTDNIDVVLADHQHYDMKMVKKIAPNLKMWVVRVQHKADISVEKLLLDIKSHDFVTEAQTDKKIQSRE